MDRFVDGLLLGQFNLDLLQLLFQHVESLLTCSKILFLLCSLFALALTHAPRPTARLAIALAMCATGLFPVSPYAARFLVTGLGLCARAGRWYVHAFVCFHDAAGRIEFAQTVPGDLLFMLDLAFFDELIPVVFRDVVELGGIGGLGTAEGGNCRRSTFSLTTEIS